MLLYNVCLQIRWQDGLLGAYHRKVIITRAGIIYLNSRINKKHKLIVG